MNYKRSYGLMWLMITVTVLLGVVEFIAKTNTLFFPACLCLTVGVVQALLFFRCPHCGKQWNIRGGIPRYCPHCGKTI